MISEPLVDWVDKNCRELGEAIDTHLKVFLDDGSDIVEPWRCIMISVRQYWPIKELNK